MYWVDITKLLTSMPSTPGTPAAPGGPGGPLGPTGPLCGYIDTNSFSHCVEIQQYS